MKIKYVLHSAFLFIFITVTLSGQTINTVKKKTVKKENYISNALGEPVYESTIDSLNTKVWIISQKKNKELMKTNMGKMMSKMDNKLSMDKETKQAVLTGTHYFIFVVTNITNGKQLAGSSAKVEIVSPLKKISSVNLQPMINHFGGGVSLDEKGPYLFTINLNIGSSYKTTQFKYKIR
jgi:hypothetical protein